MVKSDSRPNTQDPYSATLKHIKLQIMSAWQEYKNKLGETRPWDALNSKNYTDEDTVRKRMEICEDCPRLWKKTYQCKECGCFVKLKTKVTKAVCPIGKW